MQLKEYKSREASLSAEVCELERENVELEAQIAQLRRIQLEADTQRHENARLRDELALLGAQLDDLAALKVCSPLNALSSTLRPSVALSTFLHSSSVQLVVFCSVLVSTLTVLFSRCHCHSILLSYLLIF